MSKPVVRYKHYPEGQFIEVGRSALVWPIDHPGEYVTNKRSCATSKVLTYDEVTGVFETMNTIYKPEVNNV